MLFVIVLGDTSAELGQIDICVENVVLVGFGTLPDLLQAKAKHCLIEKEDQNTYSVLEDLNQKFGSYLGKRVVGIFGRYSDCQALFMRKAKMRGDLRCIGILLPRQLVLYSNAAYTP